MPVYNLTVDGQPEYFANGILVHNCTFTGAKAEKSPDRMDALVWALYDLMGYGVPPGYGGEEEGVVPYSDDGGDIARWG